MASVPRLSRLDGRGTELLLIVFVIAAGVLVGLAGVKSAKLGAVAVAALVVVMLTARRPSTLGVVAVAAVFAVQRIGGTSVAPGSNGGLTYTDAALAAAVVLAVPALIGTSEVARLRIALQGTAVYLALLVPSVIANRSTRVYLEWTHRLVMLTGALLVGAWIVRERRTRDALRLLTLVACVVSAATVFDWARHGFTRHLPFQLNKNFLGAILGAVIVLLVIGASKLELGKYTRVIAVLLVGGALLITQSRGGALAGSLGILVGFVLDPRSHSTRTKIGASLIGLALAVFAVISIRDQLNLNRQDFNNSSAGVRYNVEKVTRDIWRTQPVVGVGLKYFTTGEFGRTAVAPNNVVDNELAESGLIGLGGFVLLQVMVVAAAWRRRGEPLVAVGIGAILGQLLHGMVDIYWSAGVVALPFLLLGIGLAQEPVQRDPDDETGHTRVGAHRAQAAA